MVIRDVQPEDWEAIWPFFHRIVAAGETYAYDRDMDESTARRLWMITKPPAHHAPVRLRTPSYPIRSSSRTVTLAPASLAIALRIAAFGLTVRHDGFTR